MSNTASNFLMWSLALLAVACGKPDAAAPTALDPSTAGAPASPTATAPAGTVEAVAGQVSARRANSAAAARTLTVRDPVWADDTVVTADAASVSIRLAHNHVLWLLEGGQSRRVDAAVAWRAPPEVAAPALADRGVAATTASAGRHSEQEAGTTDEAGLRAEALAAPARAGEAMQAKRRAELEDQVKRQGVLKILGAQGEGKDKLADLFSDGTDMNSDIGEAFRGTGLGGYGGLAMDGKHTGTLGDHGSTSDAQPPRDAADRSRTLLSVKWDADPDAGASAAISAQAHKTLAATYRQVLHHQPTLAGRVTWRIRFEKGRAVDVTVVSGNVGDPKLMVQFQAGLLMLRHRGLTNQVLEISAIFQPEP